MRPLPLLRLALAPLAALSASAHALVDADDVRLADTIVLARLVSAGPAESTRAYESDRPQESRELKLGRVTLDVQDAFKGEAPPRRIEVAMNERDLVRVRADLGGRWRKNLRLADLVEAKAGLDSVAVWFLQPVNRRSKFYWLPTGSRSDSARSEGDEATAKVCDTMGFAYAVTGLEDGLAPEPVAADLAPNPSLPPYLRLLDLIAKNAESGRDALRHLRSLFALSPLREDVGFEKQRALGAMVPVERQQEWLTRRVRAMSAKAQTDLDRLNWSALLCQWGDPAGEREFVALLGRLGPKRVAVGFPKVNDPEALLILARSEDPEWSGAGFVGLAGREGLDEKVLPLALSQLGKHPRRDVGILEWASIRLKRSDLSPQGPTGEKSDLRSTLIAARKALEARKAALATPRS